VKILLTTILLISTLTTAQANLGTFKDGRLINPDTNKPYTGNLEVLNKDWGNDVVEFSKDYVDGLLHGTEKSYYKSGRLKSLGHFNQGQLDGIVTVYYEDGSVKARAFYVNDAKQGRATYYHPNGRKQQEQFYDNNVLDGTHKTWYENGNLMEVTPYSKGVIHGIGRTYYETGEVFEEVKFEYGTPKFMRVYREDGTLADEKGFFDKKVIERIVG